MKIQHCPFCGSFDIEVERTKGSVFVSLSFDTYEVVCEACDIIGPSAASELEAIDKWNNRPSPRVAETI